MPVNSYRSDTVAGDATGFAVRQSISRGTHLIADHPLPQRNPSKCRCPSEIADRLGSDTVMSTTRS